jgi:hypothetical protein
MTVEVDGALVGGAVGPHPPTVASIVPSPTPQTSTRRVPPPKHIV